MTSLFPGRVMYFPLADSIMLHGKYSAWLPPEGHPHAPNDQWIRVRKLDNVHLCPEGSARYADALLADMTAVFRLAPAVGDWSQGSWTWTPTSTTRRAPAPTTIHRVSSARVALRAGRAGRRALRCGSRFFTLTQFVPDVGHDLVPVVACGKRHARPRGGRTVAVSV